MVGEKRTMTETENVGPRNFKGVVSLMLKGFCMGIADVIPGISGGTIALLLGIYEDLIFSISSFDKKFLSRILKLRFRDAFSQANWMFLLILGLGIVLAVITLAKPLGWLLDHRPDLIYAFFFGLILATVPCLARMIRRWNPPRIILFILAAAVTFYVVGLVPVRTPSNPAWLFFGGAVGISAMIMPGISGSFILLLIGQYRHVLTAVENRQILDILVFVSGLVIGLVTFVRVLGWLFRRYHDATMAFVTGVVLGSLNKIWPWKQTFLTEINRHGKEVPLVQANVFPDALNQDVILALLLMSSGIFIAIILNAKSPRGLSISIGKNE